MHNFQNVCIIETIHHSSYHSPQFKYMNFCHKIMCQPFWLLCKWLLKKTYQTSSIKNSNFLLYSSISVKLNFINILNCRKCWLKIDWKQLVTLQSHAPGPFNTNPLCKVDKIFWRGYEAMMSTLSYYPGHRPNLLYGSPNLPETKGNVHFSHIFWYFF